MKKRIAYAALAAVCGGLGSLPVLAGQELPDGAVTAAARAGVGQFMTGVASDQLPEFGIKDKATLATANLGQGLPVYTIAPDALLDESKGTDPSQLLQATTLWEFPIMSGGKASALITVDRMGGQWTAVSVGAAGLAQQLEAVLKAWPAAMGYEYRIIRVYQARSEYVDLSKNGKSLGWIPLGSARVATGMAKSYDPADVRDPALVV